MSSQNRQFAEAYSDYFPVIFSVVYQKVGNLNDAEDLCQEIFIHFYNKMNEIKDRRKWLFGTMKYVLLNYYRKKKGDDVDIDEVFDDVKMSFVNGFRDARILIEEALENSINFKDEKERILFDLIAIRNFTYEEAGGQLGMNRLQARYRYGTIINRIVEYFRKKGINSLEDLL